MKTKHLDVYHRNPGHHTHRGDLPALTDRLPYLSHWSPALNVSSLPIHNITLFMLSRALLFQGFLARRSPLWQHYLTAGPTLLHRPLNGSAAAVTTPPIRQIEQMWAMDRLLLCCLHTFPPEVDTLLNVTLLKCLKRTEERAKIPHRRWQTAARVLNAAC